MSSNHSYQDRDLLELVAQGDQLAFNQLVQRYDKVIYPYLLYWVKNLQEVEEMVQDVFVQIWKKRASLGDVTNFSGYLFVIARNLAHSHLKKRLMAPVELSQDPIAEVYARPHAVTELKELTGLIAAAIEVLPPRRKEVFRLSREEELTYEEIAARLQISRSTVREHMVEALLFLRLHLQEHVVVFIIWLPGFLLQSIKH